MQPKLSIITINRNNAEGLKKTMQSVFSQTGIEKGLLEYIIIDGASTDNSVNIINDFLAIPENNEKVSCWVSEPDTGIYNAMNKGIKQATGEYCLFLNSGDYLVSNTIINETEVNLNADYVYGQTFTIKNNKINSWISPTTLSFSFFVQSGLCHQSTFIKRQCLIELPYNENLLINSDWEQMLLSFMAGKSFSSINKFISYYSLDGISSENVKKTLDERMAVLVKHYPQKIINDIIDYNELKNDSWNIYKAQIKKKLVIYSIISFILKSISSLIRHFNSK